VTAYIIYSDGWAQKHRGEFLLRRHPEHLQRVISAIRRRHDNETEVTFDCERSKAVDFSA
jgi:hypothetical protein